MIWRNINATRIVASTYGVLVGFAGVEHGYFEILQGNIAPESIWIDAIGPANKMWEGASETAITIIPNLLITGILSMVVGFIIILWASKFIQRKYGSLIILLLSIIQFLVGGGFAPIFIGILAAITATRINKSHTWWKIHLPSILIKSLAILWPLSFIIFILLFFLTVEIAIFGWFFGVSDPTNIWFTLAYYMLIPMVVAVPAAITYDIQRQAR